MQALHRSRLLMPVLLIAPWALPAEAQGLVRGATRTGGAIENVLTWPSVDGVERFDLYRKQATDASYPASPLNASPIEVMTDCAAISALLVPGSDDWLLVSEGLSFLPGDPASPPFDPCALSTVPPVGPQAARLELMARARWPVAVAVGQGFVDSGVTAGVDYLYQLRGLDASGAATVLESDFALTAGVPSPPSPPALVQAHPGDDQVLVTWSAVPEAAGFHVLRSDNPVGPFRRVNASAFTGRFQLDLAGELLDPAGAAIDGYVDHRRWDSDGYPTSHFVDGNLFIGPESGQTYYYKVAAVDLLGTAGPASGAWAAGTPVDTTAPLVPADVECVANEEASELEVRWQRVERDAAGHVRGDVASYRVYRYEQSDDPSANATLIAAGIPQPSGPETTLSVIDASSNLRSAFGPKTWWYRVEAEDQTGNLSSRSIAVGAYLEDRTAPASPAGVEGLGQADHIEIRWSLNTEPDIDGYQIYRSFCDLGTWEPCDEEVPPTTGQGQGEPPLPVPCPGDFHPMAYVSNTEAVLAASLDPAGKASYFDFAVPAGSPVCHGYLVKAVDTSQNLSGSLPEPDLSVEVLVCERLRDTSPPEGAILTAARARDRAIELEWIGAPTQDIAAYHVYRADAEAGPYQWIGGHAVHLPPALPTPLSAPYVPTVGDCGDVPLLLPQEMAVGTYSDKTAEPKRIYWYKVAGVDQWGNETKLANVVPLSSFTYTTVGATAPTIASVAASSTPKGLEVTWTPGFDPALHTGFALFRASSPSGPFLQVGDLVRDDSVVDSAILVGRDTWYRVASLDPEGRISELSDPVHGNLAD